MHERKPSMILPVLGAAFGGVIMIGLLAYLLHDGSLLFNTHPGGLGNFANWGELVNYDRTTT